MLSIPYLDILFNIMSSFYMRSSSIVKLIDYDGILKHMKWKVKVLVAQLCPTLCNPMDCSQTGSSVHGILQARILEWVAISFSRGSSWPKAQTQASYIAGRFFTIWATRESVTLEPNKRKSVTASNFSPSICHEVMGPAIIILVFLIEF